MTEPERIARLYEGFYTEHDSAEALPNFVSRESIQDRDPSHTTPLEAIAGFAVLALVALIFGVLL